MLYAYYEDSWKLAGKGKEAMADPSFAYFTAHRVSPHRGIRTERYKLIDYYNENGYRELFDLQSDPNELRNVYGDPKYANVQKDLGQQLEALRKQYRL
jgi:arylsulfatase A-like enzyme